MRPTVKFSELIIRANNRSDCAHGCRYCPIRRKRSIIERPRYAAFVARVKAWIEEHGVGLKLYHSLGYHHDVDRADLELMRGLDGTSPLTGISLGGLPSRTDGELLSWLSMLKEYGLQSVHATFAGAGDRHDYWNGKSGNFDLLMRTLRIAADLDLTLGQRLLVGKTTLPDLDFLIRSLAALPRRPGTWRYAMPFFYQSVAQKAQPDVEQDRIDERMRDQLPDGVSEIFRDTDDISNLSEREWIDFFANQDDPVDRVHLVIHLTARTIGDLERTPISDIVGDLEERTLRAYAAMPTFGELRSRYGDRSNRLIYALPRCVEMKWLDMYRAEHPALGFDQSLTHCWFGA
jgi:hypothetical protein